MNLTLPTRRSVAGYALLEALVAVIVTSIGFIGAARLQTLGLSFNNSAVYRQKAIQLGYQMTDRMRANQEGMRLGAYDNPVADPTLTCLTDVTGCTPGDLAQADAAAWLADVAAQLPGGEGVVCVDGTPDDGADAANPACDGNGQVFAVKIWWADTVGESRFVTVARP